MKINVIFLIVSTFYLILIGLNYLPKHELFSIYFINIGQGDASIIDINKLGVVLIDGGPDSTVELNASKYLKFPVCNLYSVFLSHFHSDHYAGLTDIINRCSTMTTFNDISVYSYDSEHFKNLLLKNLNEIPSNTDLKNSYKGDVLEFPLVGTGYLRLYILWPPKDPVLMADENDRSLVILLDYENFEVLFTGDVSGYILDDLATSEIWNEVQDGLDVYKVPHHGSPSGRAPKLLKVLKPVNCVISVGKNSYGHPSNLVLDDLATIGCNLYRTDVDGNVVFTP